MTTPMCPAASYMMYPTSPSAPGKGGSGVGSNSPSAVMRSRPTSSQLPTNCSVGSGAKASTGGGSLARSSMVAVPNNRTR